MEIIKVTVLPEGNKAKEVNRFGDKPKDVGQWGIESKIKQWESAENTLRTFDIKNHELNFYVGEIFEAVILDSITVSIIKNA